MKPVISFHLAMFIGLVQANSIAQSFEIKDGDLLQPYLVSQRDHSAFRLTYKVKTKNKKLIHYRSIDFDTSLSVVDTVSLFLKGDYSFVASAESSKSMGILMGSAYGDLILYVFDKISRQITPFRMKLASPWNEKKTTWLLTDPNLDGFLIFYEASVGQKWEILAHSERGKLTWSTQFDQPGFSILDATIEEGRIFIICGEDVGTKKERNIFRILDFREGTQLFNFELDDKENQRVIDNILPFNEEEVLLTGRSYQKKTMSSSPIELPLIWKMNLVTGEKNQIIFRTDSLSNNRILWFDIVRKNGVPCLIGEGARTASNAGATLAFGLVSGLMTGGRSIGLPNLASLKLNEVVFMPITSDRPVAKSFSVSTKEIPSSGNKPALQFIRWAHKAGKTHLLSTDANGNFFVANRGQVVAVDPFHGTKTIGKYLAEDDVIFTSAKQIIQLKKLDNNKLYIWLTHFDK
ncbi:MAG: hypothetical protein JNL17_10715 [Cyclobacteriaceae bacterium]|nr:hypothetical protein [Cyclobacteriaceae bacterium]